MHLARKLAPEGPRIHGAAAGPDISRKIFMLPFAFQKHRKIALRGH